MDHFTKCFVRVDDPLKNTHIRHALWHQETSGGAGDTSLSCQDFLQTILSPEVEDYSVPQTWRHRLDCLMVQPTQHKRRYVSRQLNLPDAEKRTSILICCRARTILLKLSPPSGPDWQQLGRQNLRTAQLTRKLTPHAPRVWLCDKCMYMCTLFLSLFLSEVTSDCLNFRVAEHFSQAFTRQFPSGEVLATHNLKLLSFFSISATFRALHAPPQQQALKYDQNSHSWLSNQHLMKISDTPVLGHQLFRTQSLRCEKFLEHDYFEFSTKILDISFLYCNCIR